MSPAGQSRASAPYDAADDEDSLSWRQVRHFIHAPRRRPLMVLVPWAAIVAIAGLSLLVLPKRYRSSTLILIESEKVPASFVPKVATEESSRRIENIKPEILSRTRLEQVLVETNPYPDIDSKARAVDKMRADTAVNASGDDGFTVEYVHRDPRKAQEVTERLTTLFITESVKAREHQVEDAVDFLVTQVADARKELEKKDAALRRFKEERMGRLPEQLQANLATMEMLQRELHSVEESLYLAREKQDALARGVSRGNAGGRSASDTTDPGSLEDLRAQLAVLRNRYTEEHPDVQGLRTRIARLEANLAQSPPVAVDATADVTRDQLKRVGLEVARLEERRSEIEKRTAVVNGRVEDTPRTEQELANLKRDYEQLSENYTALLAKQLEAQMAGRLERRWKGDRFRMLDPAHLPEKPDFPKPLQILGLGLVLGLVVGLASALAAEVMDPTIKDAEDLQDLLSLPIFARIPHLSSLPDSTRP